MRPCQKINRFILTVLFLIIASPLYSLQVAAVQWQVKTSRIESGTALKEAFNTLLYQQGFKANQPSLIVFPEYTSVFLMGSFLMDYGYINVLDYSTLAAYMRNNQLPDMYSLFQLHNKEYRTYAQGFWQDFSRDWGSFCLAGTAFVSGSSGSLYNQLWLFNPEGTLVYKQNKVYLTPFENDMKLTPGRVNDAGLVTIDGQKIGITVCRDTFFKSWEYQMQSADLWIDIKANGVEYTSEQEEIFSRALPARLVNINRGTGLTVCLNGTFNDFIWEGPSSYISVKNGKLIYNKTADRVNGDLVLVSELRNLSWQ